MRSRPQPVYWLDIEHIHTKEPRSPGFPFYSEGAARRWLEFNLGQFEHYRVYRATGAMVSLKYKGLWIPISGEEGNGALQELERLSRKTVLGLVNSGTL